ncbi:MFS family permease [Bifidobacterium commune]|uniref:Predicted arabinose efflux permease, MFS family n=1 Tax=Bifidobacterium commune TaxID=1505727 RepID=A0A1C4H2R6_9BIFI|nr:MFS transporter [Bifidobacterium commune]MBB2955034.1 MFS family permease [Bifidobacterium commune]SCC79304.1 Predicted arabinose efflux permease, MFS family [Bifidobacterium commune]
MKRSVLNNKTVGILVGIMFLAIISRFDSIISPSVAQIQKAFPLENPSKVESIVSIGASAAIVSAIIFGKILEKLSFKAVGITACLFVAFGGLTPLFLHRSVNELLVCAVIAGFGTGIITTMLPSLAAHFFHGEQLSSLMGKIMAMQDGSSMMIMYLGGLFAMSGWVHNYWLYAISLVALTFVIIFVPSDSVADTVKENENETQPKECAKQSTPAIIACEILGFFSIFLVAVLYNKLSIYVDAYHLGASDAAGIALMFNTGSSVVIGLLINRIQALLKTFTIPFAFSLMAAGAVLFIFTRSFPVVCLAAFLVGSGSAIIMTRTPYLLSNITEKKHYPFVMGIFSAISSLGFTISTWFFKLVSQIFNLDPLIGTFWCMLIISVVMAVTLIVLCFQKKIEAHYIYK